MSYKMLVAEDSPSVKETIRLAFPESEFEIFFFSDGEEVLKSANQINPDVFLLNFSLPGKDGYEIASTLQDEGSFHQVPMIFLKRAFDPLDERRVAEVEHEAIVQEPFDSERLARRVREALEKRKSPETFPEELVQEEDFLSGWNAALEERMKTMIKQEIQGMEERIKKWIRDEIHRKYKEKEKIQED